VKLTYLVRSAVNDEALTALHDLAFTGEISDRTSPWAARLATHSVSWVCAFDNGELVGFVHACWDGGNHAFLLDTAVVPGRQGQGVGRELVRCLVKDVRESGCTWLHVDYEPQLASFYQACGFAPTNAGLLALN